MGARQLRARHGRLPGGAVGERREGERGEGARARPPAALPPPPAPSPLFFPGLPRFHRSPQRRANWEGSVLITERLSISKSSSGEDNSSPPLRWKSPSPYGVSAFSRGVRKSWEAGSPPTVLRRTGTGRQPGSRRERSRRPAGGCRQREEPALPGRSGPPAAGEKSPGPSRRR